MISSATKTISSALLISTGWRVGCVGKLDLAKPDVYIGRDGARPVTFAHGFTHPVECDGKMRAGLHKEPVCPYTWRMHDQGLLRKCNVEQYCE